jgi:hypothetical protein
MTIHWIIQDKSKIGFEEEFNIIKKKIILFEEIYLAIKNNNTITKEAILLIENEIDNLYNRYDQIKVSKYETAECPRIGESKEIDEYIIENNYLKEKELKKYHGKYITELANKSEAISLNSSPFVSSLDFIGDLIISSNELSLYIRKLAYRNMTPEEMNILSNLIEEEITQNEINNRNNPKIKIYRNISKYLDAVRWLRFWSSNGHSIKIMN